MKLLLPFAIFFATMSPYALAQSTVRTHFNNLYKKLGVTSREEILALVRDGVV